MSEIKNLKEHFESIPSEIIEQYNLLVIEENDRLHRAFISSFDEGKCYLCNGEIKSFDETKFCLHWFTHPIGIKKKYFEINLNNQELCFFDLETYLRWVAETDKPLVNINDLKSEMSLSSFFEEKIRYKNIEWSFSIGESDKEGHEGKFHGLLPHYHMQMLVNGKSFIRFSDLHILFTEVDKLKIEYLQQIPDRTKWVHPHGQGMSLLENENVLELIDESLIITDDEENATFSTSTFIEAPNGQGIPIEIINDAIRKSNESGKPISHFMKDLLPDIGIEKIISAGDCVPEIAKRSGKH